MAPEATSTSHEGDHVTSPSALTPNAPPPKPKRLRRGERLDLYPASLPRGQPPPLASEVVLDDAQVVLDDTQVVPDATPNVEETVDNPPAPTFHLPPTYFLGWLYQEDAFYERFANKDDEDAWDIYEGFKEVVTRPFRDKYPGMSVCGVSVWWPDFDIEDESKECIVYIAYNLEESSRADAQDQAFTDAAKDILEEAREPMWYRRI